MTKPTITQSPEWWKQGVIYQIYPKSFQDTTNNGIGDLQGIIQRLDYLQKLGVDAIWITPIYVSPQVDNGYDVADYCAIDPTYGTMQDFELLIEQAHLRNIRIIMDMVFNHTSTEHQWFKAAQDSQSPYHSFYIWRGEDPAILPNNWRSKFGGNAWQWSEKVNSHYLHLFAPEQADLNWENPQVRAELQNICHFWADKGVDGLRLDVINLISKNQDFPDDNQGDGRRFYTDGERIHEFLQEFSQNVFQPRQLMTVGEMSSTSLEHCQQYANLKGTELSMTFNFHHLKVDYPNGEKWTYAKPDFVELKQIFNYWQQGMHGRAWNALFWCNHDQPRIVSRFGDEQTWHKESAKMLAMVLYGMEGTPYIYQGEEIGMTNPNFTDINQYRDVESLNMYEELHKKGVDKSLLLKILGQKSRDNSRTPMQWDNSQYCGFSQSEPWINIGRRDINVAQALDDKTSIFYTYQRLITLRKKYSIFINGTYQDLHPTSSTVWTYLRENGQETLLVLANLTAETQKFELPIELVNQQWRLLENNYTQEDEPQVDKTMTLLPFQGLYFYQSH